MDFTEIDSLFAEGLTLGRQGVVGALVVRPDGRVFAQRRSPQRRLFPGCWDLVGGHVERGESPREALIREVSEETGWRFESLLGLRRVVDWESPGENGVPVLKREFVVAVSVAGDWDRPRLEPGKATEGRWFGPQDLAILNENRQGQDNYVFNLYLDYFSSPGRNNSWTLPEEER
jgi:8-oxo-dGTP pyrophosphatase MutT (NUDIX family)